MSQVGDALLNSVIFGVTPSSGSPADLTNGNGVDFPVSNSPYTITLLLNNKQPAALGTLTIPSTTSNVASFQVQPQDQNKNPINDVNGNPITLTSQNTASGPQVTLPSSIQPSYLVITLLTTDDSSSPSKVTVNLQACISPQTSSVSSSTSTTPVSKKYTQFYLEELRRKLVKKTKPCRAKLASQ